MAAPLRLLIEFVAATLGAVAANGKQDINVAPNEVVHSCCHIDWTARSAEYCSAMLVNVINKCMGDHRRFQAAPGIKTLITAPEPEHLGDSVGMMEFKEQRADHVVQAWA